MRPLEVHKSILAGALLVALLAGCAGQERIVEREPLYQDEVGSVGVAVVSAAPWELFVSSLQPSFTLKPEDALTEATATTRQIEDRFARTVEAIVKLAPGVLSENRSTTTGTDAAGATTTTSSSTRTAAPGDVSKVTGPTLPASVLPEALSGPVGTPAVNATLRYQLATALYQEVQLLNRYVSAAPRLAGYKPFIVRLQVNVRQRGRNTPYDADVSVAFMADRAMAAARGGPGKGVVAIPLLVNDSMDVASAAVSRQNIATLGAALSLLRGNFGVGAEFGSRTERMLRAMGNEFNSLLSVARSPASESAIDVRVGALDKGVDRHEMVPRSHMVTLMLLVPDDMLQKQKPDSEPAAVTKRQPEDADGGPVARLRFATHARFSHARTGAVLPFRSAGEPSESVAALLDASGVRKAALPELRAALATNDWQAFRTRAGCQADMCAPADRLWAALSVDTQGSLFGGSGRFEVQGWREPRLPSSSQRAQVQLAGEKAPFGAGVNLRGGDALISSFIDVACLLPAEPAFSVSLGPQVAPQTNGSQRKCDGQGAVIATKVEVDGDRNGLMVGFGSRFQDARDTGGQLRLAGSQASEPPLSRVCIDPVSTAQAGFKIAPVCVDLGPTLPDPQLKPKPRLAADVSVSDRQVLAATDGSATLSLAVKFVPVKLAGVDVLPDRVSLRLQGAGVAGLRLADTAATGCATQKADIEVTADCAFTLRLSNASPRVPVRLSATASKGPPGAADAITQPLAPEPDALDVFTVPGPHAHVHPMHCSGQPPGCPSGTPGSAAPAPRAPAAQASPPAPAAKTPPSKAARKQTTTAPAPASAAVAASAPASAARR